MGQGIVEGAPTLAGQASLLIAALGVAVGVWQAWEAHLARRDARALRAERDYGPNRAHLRVSASVEIAIRDHRSDPARVAEALYLAVREELGVLADVGNLLHTHLAALKPGRTPGSGGEDDHAGSAIRPAPVAQAQAGSGHNVVVAPTIVMAPAAGPTVHGADAHGAAHGEAHGHPAAEDPRLAVKRFAEFWARDDVARRLHDIVDELTDVSCPPARVLKQLEAAQPKWCEPLPEPSLTHRKADVRRRSVRNIS